MSVTTELSGSPAPASRPPETTEPRRVGGGLLDPKILLKSTPDAFKKLDPRVQIKNPVMFVVEVGAVLCVYTAVRSPQNMQSNISRYFRPSFTSKLRDIYAH